MNISRPSGAIVFSRKGWLTMPIKFSPITLSLDYFLRTCRNGLRLPIRYGRIKTPKGFCLEPWHGDPLLQPCTADGSQLQLACTLWE